MVLTLWTIRRGNVGEVDLVREYAIRRGNVGEVDLVREYADLPSMFSFKIHHSGMFSKFPNRRYLDGQITYVDFVDLEVFSVHELDAMMKEMGYTNKKEMFYYHYVVPDTAMDYGLSPLGNDDDVRKLSRYVTAKNKLIDVFIEHNFTRVHTYFMSPSKVLIEEIDDEGTNLPTDSSGPSTVVNKKDAPSPRQLLLDDANTVEDMRLSMVSYVPTQSSQCGSSTVDDVSVTKEATRENVYVPKPAGDDYDPVGFDAFQENVQFNTADLDIPYTSSEDESGSRGNVIYNIHSGDSDEEEWDVSVDSDGVEGAHDADGSVDSDGVEGKGDDAGSLINDNDIVEDIDVDMSNFKCSFDDGMDMAPIDIQDKDQPSQDDDLYVLDNDSFESPVEENLRKKLLMKSKKPVVCSSGVVHKRIFKVGQVFKTKQDFKSLAQSHAVETRRDLYYAKNDKTRRRVKCRGIIPTPTSGSNQGILHKDNGKNVNSEACPWVVYMSRSDEHSDWIVKTIIDHHTFLPTRSVRVCNAKYIARNIVDQIERNPTIPITALREDLELRFGVGMSIMKAFRAKRLTQKEVEGDYEQQYALLRDYVMELQACNEGTTVKIEVDGEPNLSVQTRTFKRIYVCLGVLKQGFKASKREILGLDGTFMKGPYPGQILTAVGIDANNGIYPVAYAVVEAESKDSWTWFLENLGDDLDLDATCNFTFISDRQKGIIPAMKNVFPRAEHKYCLRHILQNMKLQWKGDDLKDQVWKCATATTKTVFDKEMLNLKAMNAKAYHWICRIPVRHCARAHFTGRAVSDILLNNLCEVFNAKLKLGRDKPIITCLEYIRVYCMKRICIVQKEIDKCKVILTPTATCLLEDIKMEANKYTCIYAGAGKFQVSGPWMDQCAVNLRTKTCTCRRWELNGIPCKHAVRAMWNRMENRESCPAPEEWLHECYKLSTWKEVYSHTVSPISGRNMWKPVDCPFMLTPPVHHTQVGRPKKQRKKSADEISINTTNLSRKYLDVTCGKCGNKGHNSRTCKGQGGNTQKGKGNLKRKSGKGPTVGKKRRKRGQGGDAASGSRV